MIKFFYIKNNKKVMKSGTRIGIVVIVEKKKKKKKKKRKIIKKNLII